MSMASMYLVTNQLIARSFWYTTAGTVGLLAIIRITTILQSRQRRRQHERHPKTVPSRPQNPFSQAWATTIAIFREATYSQPLHFAGRFSRFFTPLPTGHWLFLAAYWVFILTALWSNTILGGSDLMRWEIVGYRAAWVSLMQIPLIYLLSTKLSPISALTGIGYERLNWLHRWAARTVFLTLIVHWSYFWREWTLAGILEWQISTMPSIVTYGFAAWGVIGWLVLSGFGFFRALAYEVWVAQHIIAGWLLLWLIYVHVPDYAKYNVWLSVAFLVLDRAGRLAWTGLRNLHVLGRPRFRMPGYSATLEALEGETVRLSIEDVDFSWTPGQHAFLSVPRVRPFENHPFTIANTPTEHFNGEQRRLTFLIQARSGFTRSLYQAATKSQGRQYRALLSGPWGAPPDLLHFDTVVLIACSSGASYIVPVLQNLVRKRGCVRYITLHWIIRSEDHFAWFQRELMAVVESAQQQGLVLRAAVHVTRSSRTEQMLSGTELNDMSVQQRPIDRSDESSSSESARSTSDEKAGFCHRSSTASTATSSTGLTMLHGQRPTLESMIRRPVEAALGETAVIVCGGPAVTAQTRTYVAALSDERAVHKGTGAQGIFLHVETYGW